MIVDQIFLTNQKKMGYHFSLKQVTKKKGMKMKSKGKY